MEQPDVKCSECSRTTATHASGCSHIECPHRKAHAWCGTEGSQGFPGQLAEERILRRRRERHYAVEVDLSEL